MRKAKAEKKKKKKREEEEEEGNVTIPISTSNEKKEKKEKKQYEENIVEGEHNNHKIKKKNMVSEEVISWKEEEEEEEEVLDYLPGQKHDRPGQRDPLRIFYETLYQKAPDCELAETWMMEWGLLPPKVAEKVYETKFRHNQQMSPEAIKAASASEVPKNRKESKRLSNPALKTKKRKSSEANSVDDFRPQKKRIKQQVSST